MPQFLRFVVRRLPICCGSLACLASLALPTLCAQSAGPAPSSVLTGQIVMEPQGWAHEPIRVELTCGAKRWQVTHTQRDGSFTLDLRASKPSYATFSAATDSTAPFETSAGNPTRGYQGPMVGCELQVSVQGFHSLKVPVTEHGSVVDVGTLHLRRFAAAEGSSISVTSLLVPKGARKEFEKALQEMQRNRPDRAGKKLEEAVRLYDSYAAAWNELGRLRLADGKIAGAEEAFEKAVAADPQYVPPYLNLAMVRLQDRQWQRAVDTAARALQLDPDIGFAWFAQAVGNFELHRLDAAEQSAREAEKRPHDDTPQLHALLAEILLQREAYSEAVAEMQTYLEESPHGKFAKGIKEVLEEIEKTGTLTQSVPDPPGNPAP